jgi:hypothetical protein
MKTNPFKVGVPTMLGRNLRWYLPLLSWDMTQTRRMGMQSEGVQLPRAPRFSPCYGLGQGSNLANGDAERMSALPFQNLINLGQFGLGEIKVL